MRHLAQMKVSTRLFVGFGLVVLLMLGSGIYPITLADRLGELTRKLYRHPMAVATAVYRADANIVRMHRDMKDVALPTDEDSCGST